MDRESEVRGFQVKCSRRYVEKLAQTNFNRDEQGGRKLPLLAPPSPRDGGTPQ